MTPRCECPEPRVKLTDGKYWCLICGHNVATTANKFGARRTSCGAHIHDSKREAERCRELQLQQKGRLIASLEFHPVYELKVGGVLICKYEADWRYFEARDLAHTPVIEDLKGKRTAVYRIKRKLMKACYGIDIRETA